MSNQLWPFGSLPTWKEEFQQTSIDNLFLTEEGLLMFGIEQYFAERYAVTRGITMDGAKVEPLEPIIVPGIVALSFINTVLDRPQPYVEEYRGPYATRNMSTKRR